MAMKFVRNCRSRPWPVFHSSKLKETEETVMVDIASNILINLCREVTMYRVDVATMPALTTSVLGLGTPMMWYNAPDAQVRGVAICCGIEEEEVCGGDEGDSDSDSTTTDGTAVHIEGKIRYNASNLPQAVATCVVSSFT